MNVPIITLISAMLLVFAGCHSEPNSKDTIEWTTGKNMTKNMSKNGVVELSGLHWSPALKRLYAIQDNGGLHVLQLDTVKGKFQQIAHFEGLDGPEGITQVTDNPDEFYTIDEKSCEIRRYTHADDFSSLAMACSWNLKAAPSNMTVLNNEGPEGIEFVPDRFLKGFISSITGKPYRSTKGMHGLLFVAHQEKGLIWVFDVNPNKSNDFNFVGTYQTSREESCDLAFDQSTGLLYILHNTKHNYLEVTDLTTEVSGDHYRFVTKREYSISKAPGNNNIEGFALSTKFSTGATCNAWLCRDVDIHEKGKDRKDCLRWFKGFDAVQGNK